MYQSNRVPSFVCVCLPGGGERSDWPTECSVAVGDLGVAGVITASGPSWTAPFTGLSPRCFGKLLTALRREGADEVSK